MTQQGGIENPALQVEEDKEKASETERNGDAKTHTDDNCVVHGNLPPGGLPVTETSTSNGAPLAGSDVTLKLSQNENDKVKAGAGSETSGKRAVTHERCARIAACCTQVVAPLEAASHPLPANATLCDRLKRAFFCPPFGRVGAVLLVIVVFFTWWAALISITNTKALPGGIIFPILVLFVCCWCGGYAISLVRLPPLFGMLIMGGILGNVPGISVGRLIDPVWSSTARSIALTVILTRAGLGLDPAALKRLSLVVLRLAFCPSIVEAVIDSLTAHFILGFPWTWAFMLGFVLAVVSPAVVVPSMLGLSDCGYGLNKGIPTLVVAAVSLDAVLAITGFGVMLSITFSSGNIAWTLCQGPLQAVVGIAAGCLAGFVLWYIPQRSSKHLVLFRSVLLVGGGLVAIFGSKYVGWSGAGPLACLAVAFVSGLRWRKECVGGQKTPVEEVMGVLWMVFQPLLFGLIGAKVDLKQLHPTTVGLGAAVIAIGLLCRLVVAFLTTMNSGLILRERFFIPLSWIPKATVQAAIGGVALDTATELKAGDEAISLGKQILTLAVLAIILTAPIGSLLIALVGPRLLHKTEPSDHSNNQHHLKQAVEVVDKLEDGTVTHLNPPVPLNDK